MTYIFSCYIYTFFHLFSFPYVLSYIWGTCVQKKHFPLLWDIAKEIKTPILLKFEPLFSKKCVKWKHVFQWIQNRRLLKAAAPFIYIKFIYSFCTSSNIYLYQRKNRTTTILIHKNQSGKLASLCLWKGEL